MRYLKHFVLAIWILCNAISHANVDRVVVVVNDDALTVYDVDKFRKGTLFFIQEKDRDRAATELDHKINDMLVEHTLLLQFAKKSGIEPTEEQVKSFKQSNLSRIGISDAQLAEKLNEMGLESQDLDQFIRETVTVYSLRNKVISSKIQLSPHKVKYYREKKQLENTKFTFNDYLIPVKEENAYDKALTLQNSLKSYTRIPANLKSIVVKTVFDNELPNAIPDVFLSHLKSNQPEYVTKVIKANNGYHAIWFRKVKKPTLISENQAMQELFSKNADEVYSKWIKEVKGSSYIHIFE